MSDRKKNFLKMLLTTIVAIAIAGVLCFGFIKIGYKTGAIKTIPPIPSQEEPDKPVEPVEETSALENMFKTLKQMTIDKLASQSGQERTNGEKISMSLFKYSPIVGIGLGSHRTFSLFTNILVNTGILGIISFLYIIFIVLKQVIKYRKKNEVISLMFFVSILSTTISLFVRSTRFCVYILLDDANIWI